MPAQDLAEFVCRNRDKVAALFERYRNSGKNLFLHSDLWDEYKIYCMECEGGGFLESPCRIAADGGPNKLQPVDMFPQTHHIETVALLEKEPTNCLRD